MVWFHKTVTNPIQSNPIQSYYPWYPYSPLYPQYPWYPSSPITFHGLPLTDTLDEALQAKFRELDKGGTGLVPRYVQSG